MKTKSRMYFVLRWLMTWPKWHDPSSTPNPPPPPPLFELWTNHPPLFFFLSGINKGQCHSFSGRGGLLQGSECNNLHRKRRKCKRINTTPRSDDATKRSWHEKPVRDLVRQRRHQSLYAGKLLCYSIHLCLSIIIIQFTIQYSIFHFIWQ